MFGSLCAVDGWRCAVCATRVRIDAVHPFRCPRSTGADPRHVLHPVVGASVGSLDHPNPFVRYGRSLAWWAFARAHGMSTEECVGLTEDVAAGFAVTPYAVAPNVSDAVGREVWIKDETGNVGGSHKGRHLVTILLHLRAAEELGVAPYGTVRPPLAIASCGNAAIAAATLAARVGWTLRVFVPDWADDTVVRILDGLGAEITRCPRRPDDPAGDPAVLRFREAVAAGALPFSVQGPENALCLDGGRTLGWELADADTPPERVLVQVGGGAFAACVGWGLGPGTRLDTVQTGGCAPLARAWDRSDGVPDDQLGQRWDQLMTPWPDPHSAADGILDDETYDWLGDIEVMRRSGGRPIVATERQVLDAHDLAQTTAIPVSATGSAGLAGLLADPGDPTERVAVVFSGITRPT